MSQQPSLNMEKDCKHPFAAMCMMWVLPHKEKHVQFVELGQYSFVKILFYVAPGKDDMQDIMGSLQQGVIKGDLASSILQRFSSLYNLVGKKWLLIQIDRAFSSA